MAFWKSLFGGKEPQPQQPGGEVVHVERRLDVPVDRAFEVFVDKFGAWWPRDLTWAGDQLEGIVIEPKMGGRCFERSRDGTVAIFGKVLAVERPSHIVLAWQIRPDRTPEPEEGMSSRVDVRFVADGADKSAVVVVHRDFFRHGDGWQAYRAEMASKKGWPRLIDLYAEAVRRP